MKKFLSMLLVLCMVFTTLMGTMVVDVNAAVTKDIMSYTIEEGTEEDYSDRNVIVDMPQSATSAFVSWPMLYGNWRINTPYYDAAKTDSENEGYYIDIGSFKKYDAVGVEFVHMDNPTEQSIELVDSESSGFSYAKNMRYHFSPTVVPESRKFTEEQLESGYFTQGIQGMTEADINANIADGKKVAHISLYAFSKRGEGTVDLSFYRQSSSGSGITAATINGADIVSANGIPRKFDIFLYADCDDSDLLDGATYTNVKIYVDGKYYKATRGKVNASATLLSFVIQKEMYIHKENSKTISITSPVNDLYLGYKDTAFEYITRDEASALTFEEINYTTYTKGGTVNENLATGVTDDIDEKLESVLVNSADEDKVIEVYKSVYDNPALIYDTDNSTDANVVLVDKATGEVYDESNIPAGKTLDDLYISVNGVFVLAESVADPAFVKNGNDITYKLNAEELKGFDVGNWILSNGTEEAVLGTTSDGIVNAGKTFKKFLFNQGSISGATNSIKFRSDIKSGSYLSDDIEYTQNDISSYLTVAEANTALTKVAGEHSDDDGVVIFTLYAYSTKTTGPSLNLRMSREDDGGINASLYISPADLYSADGVPHKIDVIWYGAMAGSKFASSSNSNHRHRIYIDGLQYSATSAKFTIDRTLGTSDGRIYIAPTLNMTPVEGTMSWDDAEWYILDSGVSSIVKTNRGNASTTLFETMAWEQVAGANLAQTMAACVVKEDVVNGVTADVDAKLNAVLLSKTVDNVIELPESIYNNPVAIFDGTAANVKLIDKVTGAEYTSVNKTFDDLYISVNDVYVLVKSVPDADLTYDKIQKLASVRANLLSAGTTCQIVVAAYNDDKLADIKVSGQLTAEADMAVEYTATGIEEGAEEYKIFVFDALNTIKPLVEALIVR